ncbi:MAG: phosphoribosyltransferase family protein [Paraglaciecola sp.]|uniref:phosphoribosyltransferase n=1 Tax=Paraglaciecola sp. TaxID=1920173 RepID=UPI0032638061
MEKTYLTGEQLLADSFKLAKLVFDSGYRPTFIIAVWRGGAPIGIAVQEFLNYHGIETDNIAIRTSSYAAGIDKQSREVKVHDLNYLIKKVQHCDKLLIVDDVFDTGRSIEAIIKNLQEKTRLNMPEDIRVAVPFYKPTRREVDRIPDYYVHETAAWLKYPHSLEGLTVEEMAEHRPELYEIVKEHLPNP